MATSSRLAASDVVETPRRVSDAFELVWDKLNGWLHDFILLLPNLIVGAIVALLCFIVAKAVSYLLHRAVARSGRRDLGYVLGRFVFWLMLVLGMLVVLTIVLPSMHPVDIFASLGVGSIAVGFAFKDLLQNWLAGLLILIRRPFKRGDQIKVGAIEGTVQAVETRATLVKTFSGRLVIIPNSDIYTQSVTVNTAYDIRRTEIVVPVGMEIDLDQAIEVILAALDSVEDILKEPKPDVLPWEFVNNNVNIVVRWWTKSQRSYEVRTRSQAVRAIKQGCEAAGIALPADTKISFAAPEFVVALKRAAERQHEPPKPPAAAAPPKPPAEAPVKPPTTGPEERDDPEAEKPHEGELNESAEALPR
jgi:small-conductance mechanosensitive channel